MKRATMPGFKEKGTVVAISADLHTQIQKHGANARSRRESQFDNPYLRADHMPAATGESVEVWNAKHDAWEIGWRAEDLMRA